MGLIEGLLGRGGPLPTVEHRLTVRAGSSDAPELLDAEDWHVLDVELEEDVSRPYRLTVTLVTEDLGLDVRGLVGGTCRFETQRGESERVVHGVVRRAEYAGTHARRLHLRLVIGPALGLLDLSQRPRIFQDQTVPEIVRQVVGEVFARYDRAIDTTKLLGTYEPRDYCVQWDETDLGFLERLLAEEGIAYVFDQTGDTETLVLVDDNASFRPVGVGATEPRGAEEEPTWLPVISEGASEADVQSVQQFSNHARLWAAHVEASGWDWMSSPPARVSTSLGTEPEYDRLGERWFDAERRSPERAGAQVDLTERWAELELQRHGARAERFRGRSNVIGLAPGSTFELADHPFPELDQQYVVTRVLHWAHVPHPEGGDPRGGSYHNVFECQRLDSPVRPERQPKPRMLGPQTAVVVGPEGEEIHTDRHGRVKVRFHWDREGAQRGGHETSCWLRVAQAWAGVGFGALFVPRVGMEVVVSFLGGDPDRPLMTGCVYNGQNVPPQTLPEDKTKTTFRTSSSPGGAGFNELTFEDAADHEEIFLHAQRNLRQRIRAFHSTSVGVDQSLTVHRDRKKTIEGSETTTVRKDVDHTVEGSVKTRIGGSVEWTLNGGGNQTPECTVAEGEFRAHVNADTLFELDERRTMRVRCGRTLIVISDEGIEIEAPRIFLASNVSDARVVLNPKAHEGGVEVQAKQARTIVGGYGSGIVELVSNDKSSVLLESEAARVQAPQVVSRSEALTRVDAGRLEVESRSHALLKADEGVLSVKAKSLSMHGHDEASLSSDEHAEVSCHGPTKITSKSDVVVQGTVIRLN